MTKAELSADRRTMTVHGTGRKMVLQSAKPDGFTDDEIKAATAQEFASPLSPGQTNRARRFQAVGWDVFVHANTGPPTWWWPRLEVERHDGEIQVMVGWIRGLLAVHATRDGGGVHV
jgi:hypothetical protein